MPGDHTSGEVDPIRHVGLQFVTPDATALSVTPMIPAGRRLCAFVIAAAVLTSACNTGSASSTSPNPKNVIRIQNGSAYLELLAREYGRLMPDVTFDFVSSPPMGTAHYMPSLDRIMKGTTDLAMILADAAFSPNVNNMHARRQLQQAVRAIGVLHVAPLHLLVRPGLEIESLGNLRGRRVGTVVNDNITEWVLEAFGLTDAIVRVGPFPRSRDGNALAQGPLDAVFAANRLDALFITNYYPATLVEDGMRAGLRLTPIEGKGLDTVFVEHPFIDAISIPRGVYPGQEERVRTVAIPIVLACSRELDEDLVYRLTAHLLNAVSQVPLYNTAMRHITVQEASATPIPLHDGAARYYRESEILR